MAQENELSKLANNVKYCDNIFKKLNKEILSIKDNTDYNIFINKYTELNNKLNNIHISNLLNNLNINNKNTGQTKSNIWLIADSCKNNTDMMNTMKNIFNIR
jgi:hypothetical protein